MSEITEKKPEEEKKAEEDKPEDKEKHSSETNINETKAIAEALSKVADAVSKNTEALSKLDESRYGDVRTHRRRPPREGGPASPIDHQHARICQG